MSDLASLAYFCPPIETFWTWDEGGRVATWAGGRTIAFREEIDRILENLVSVGFPHLDTVLLLMAACRDGWRKDSEEVGLLAGLARSLRVEDEPLGFGDLLSVDVARRLVASSLASPGAAGAPDDTLHRLTIMALETLDRVHVLFARSKKGLSKMELLIRHLLDGVAPRRASIEAASILAVFRQGFTEEGLVENVTRARIRAAPRRRFIETLNDVLSILPHGRLEDQDLDLLARTGLEAEPAAADVEVPSARRARSLLAELLDDESLHGLAALARELAAVVHIPRRVEDSDELPSGGFSDLTNRGSLDRLVLSELAHDDTTLAVRVAMNEALYLRREVPPRGPDRARALLVDTGIRLWGAPRVFAAATALAAAATADSRQDVHAFEARGGGIEEIDLLSREGLCRHLETLETTVHAGDAVRAFAEECRRRAIGDAVFITEDDVFEDPDFRKVLDEVWSDELYVITVNREGGYRLRRWTERGVKDLQKAVLDLETILQSGGEAGGKGNHVPGKSATTDDPLILSMRPRPLRTPCQVRIERSTYHPRFGMVSVTKDLRFVQWNSEELGPLELLDTVPRGRPLFFEASDDGWAHVLSGRRSGGAYPLLRVHLVERRHEIVDLHPTDDETRGVLLRGGGLIWIGERTTEVFSPTDGARIHSIPTPPRSWLNRGRIFFQQRRYRALDFDGRTLSLHGGSAFHRQIVTCFERKGLDGVWAVTTDGRVLSTGGEEIRFAPAKFSGRMVCTGISADGHRLVLHDITSRDRKAWLRCDLQMRSTVPVDGTAESFLCPWIVPYLDPERRKRQEVLQKVGRLRGVLVTKERVLLLSGRRGALYRLAVFHGGLYFAIMTRGRDAPPKKGPLGREPAEATSPEVKPFEPLGGEGHHGVRMAVATWPDGSRILADGRGLIHLKSSDPDVPEVSIVLRMNGETAGWASNGEVCGPKYYHGSESTIDPALFYRNIEAFLNRLPL